MKITIVHPSRGRPDQARNFIVETMDKISGNHEIQWILSIDADEKEKYLSKFTTFFMSMYRELDILVNKNENHVQAVNVCMPFIKGEMIIVTGEDWRYPPHWDQLLVSKVKGDDWVIAIKDGIQPKMITLPIMSRKYMERFPWIYFPEFESMFCDAYWTNQAYNLDKVIEAKDLFFEHLHFSIGKSKSDTTYLVQTSPDRYKRGKLVYDRLMKDNNLKDVL